MKKKGKNQHVVRRDDGWAVLGEGESQDTLRTDTQREAVERAREIAQKSGTEVVIHGRDGKIQGTILRDGETEYRLADRIVFSPNICHGKPRVKGTRIMVHLVLDLLAAGRTIDEIISDDYYPELTREDVLACMAFSSQLTSEQYVPTEGPEISVQRMTPKYDF